MIYIILYIVLFSVWRKRKALVLHILWTLCGKVLLYFWMRVWLV